MLTEYKPESVVRSLYFGEHEKAETSEQGITSCQPRWCMRSETRLFQKVLECKPAGINKHFNLSRLVNFLSNIHEDEDTDFEMFLSPEDFEVYKSRKEIKEKKGIMIFKPAYAIRPTAEQILEKLGEHYNMENVNKNEALPEEFENDSDFYYSTENLRQPVDLIRTPRRLRESNF
uniref:Uncharacterized protein n=1 Tax=Acrobeloides nanus TaxID=290746 RepID=A0A914E5L9_9BILA